MYFSPSFTPTPGTSVCVVWRVTHTFQTLVQVRKYVLHVICSGEKVCVRPSSLGVKINFQTSPIASHSCEQVWDLHNLSFIRDSAYFCAHWVSIFCSIDVFYGIFLPRSYLPSFVPQLFRPVSGSLMRLKYVLRISCEAVSLSVSYFAFYVSPLPHNTSQIFTCFVTF